MEYRLTRPRVAPEVIDLGNSAVPRYRPRTHTPIVDVGHKRRGVTLDELRRLDPSAGINLVLDGRYRLERLIGHGGMGAVYLAFDLTRARRVAVKILDIDEQEHRWGIAQFLHEARMAASVRHHNVIDVQGFGSTPEGIVYMAMEHLDGRDLEAIAQRRQLSWRWARYMMRQVCAGLEAVHRAGIVHRDVKASNCFYVKADATIKILDFGVATRLGDASASTTSVIGTPEYMAPEQIRGRAVDHRADVYAAGVLLCKLLTGRTPFRGNSVEDILDQQLHDEPPALSELADGLDAPAGLDAVVRRALAKDPERRFPSMLALAVSLDELEASAPIVRQHERSNTRCG